MQNKVRIGEAQVTIVCVDEYQDGVLSGRLYNPHLGRGRTFKSLMQYLACMEEVLESMHFSQPFLENRFFVPVTEAAQKVQSVPDVQSGKLATFAVRVLFRQNASWQGSVMWLEEGREESFRSTLELILLMDSALRSKG